MTKEELCEKAFKASQEMFKKHDFSWKEMAHEDTKTYRIISPKEGDWVGVKCEDLEIDKIYWLKDSVPIFYLRYYYDKYHVGSGTFGCEEVLSVESAKKEIENRHESMEFAKEYMKPVIGKLRDGLEGFNPMDSIKPEDSGDDVMMKMMTQLHVDKKRKELDDMLE